VTTIYFYKARREDAFNVRASRAGTGTASSSSGPGHMPEVKFMDTDKEFGLQTSEFGPAK
jgi:hypothetical protein